MKYKKNSLQFADAETLVAEHRGQLLPRSPTRRENMGALPSLAEQPGCMDRADQPISPPLYCFPFSLMSPL